MEASNEVVLYQTSTGSLEFRRDETNDTIWANRMQMAVLFDVNPQAITKHIKNIYKDQELNISSTSSNLELVRIESGRTVKRNIDHYNLEMIISVGYRINSIKATKFRQWATKTLKEHIVRGFSINHDRLAQNKEYFLETLDHLKLLTENNQHVETKDILSLIQTFSNTFFALDSYDKNEFPSHGSREEVQFTAQELQNDLIELKKQLISKGEATDLFGQEKKEGALKGIFASVFQTVFGEDAYPTIEEKAAHLLYFIVKNHPFNDGNKRSGAFSFIWFLQKTGFDFMGKISPETLTTLTILIAESNPVDKNKMIGIVQLLLNSRTTNTIQN